MHRMNRRLRSRLWRLWWKVSWVFSSNPAAVAGGDAPLRLRFSPSGRNLQSLWIDMLSQCSLFGENFMTHSSLYMLISLSRAEIHSSSMLSGSHYAEGLSLVWFSTVSGVLAVVGWFPALWCLWRNAFRGAFRAWFRAKHLTLCDLTWRK